METMISIRKIIENVKRFWWICLLTTALAAAFVGYSTIQTYRGNKSAENRDSYIGSATLYLSSDNEKDNRAYAALLTSRDTISRIDAVLEELSMEPYSSATDSLAIQSMSDSTAYGITVISIGEERTQTIGQAVIELVLDTASEVMGVDSGMISSLVVSPCLWYTDGTYRTVSSPDQRIVTLSLSDFISWRKLVIVCAGFFLGAALIFVAVLFDDKIRDIEEVRSAVPDIPCLGLMNLSDRGDSIPDHFLQEYLGYRQFSSLVILTSGLSGNTGEKLKETLGTQISVMDVEDSSFSADGFLACDGVLAVMQLNRNTMRQLRNAISAAALYDRKVDGILLVRMS